MQYYVYLHFKPNGELFYIGKGSGRRARRLIVSNRSKYHSAIVNKYGKENIECLIFSRDSEQDAFETEKAWIKVAREAGIKLCNHTDGGEGASGNKPSIESRIKMSLAQLRLRNNAEYVKKNLQQLASIKELGLSAARKANASLKNNPVFFEQWMHQFKIAAIEGRKSASIKRQKRVECTTLGIVFNSIQDAAKHTSMHPSMVSLVCSGKLSSAKALQFKFI